MNSDKNIENLLEVSNLRKDIKTYFINKVLSDQGLQTELSKVFKPITESQNKNSLDLIKLLKDSANENNKKIIDFKDTFQNFPQLVESINNIKSALDIKTNEIINEIKAGRVVPREVEEVVGEAEEFAGALDDISRGEEDKPEIIHEIDDSDLIKKAFETAETLDAYSISNNYEKIKNELKKPEIQQDLLVYIEQKPKTNLSSNPWIKYREINGNFYTKLKERKEFAIKQAALAEKEAKKTPKKGKGLGCQCSGSSIKFLSNNKENLVKELFRLLGSYKSGNKGVYNELNAVVDELRRSGVLTIDQSKKLYKSIK